MIKRTLLKQYYKLISKTYKKGNFKLRYLEKKRRTNTELVVIFSAFPREGLQATYNYTKTLKNIAADQLFLLDSFGYKKRGAFYLAEEGDFSLEEEVTEVIEKIVNKKNYKKVIFVGSSKGGYAAMYFGLKLQATELIIGGNPYYLGNYLTDSPVKQPILTAMIGNECNQVEKVAQLNYLLPNMLSNQETLPKIYLHYSINDHMYQEHIKSLISDFREKNGVIVKMDIEDYQKHQDIRFFFPKFLQETLAEILEEK